MNLRRMRMLIDRYPRAVFAVDKAMARATKCTSVLTGMPRGGAGGNQVADGAEQLAMAKETRDRIRRELREMREELTPYIEKLEDPLEKTVAQLRYIDGMSCFEISLKLGYTDRHIRRKVKDAEINLEKMSVMSAQAVQ